MTAPLLPLPALDLGSADLRALASPRTGPLLSIYLPAGPVPEARRYSVQAKSRIAEAAERLAKVGVGPEEVERRAAQLRDVAGSLAPAPGTLALFQDAHELRAVALARDVREELALGGVFRLRPLLGALPFERVYRVLAVSPKRVALYEGSARGLEPAALAGIPAGLEDALGSELTEKEIRVRGTSAGGGAPIFYAHGDARAEKKLDTTRFHRFLARALERRFARDETPLVLAADGVHLAALHDETRLPGLVAGGVAASPDRLSAPELHARAWPLVEAAIAARERGGPSAYERARNLGKGVDALDDVAAAAAAGRVHRLWLDGERRFPGTIDDAGRVLASGAGDDDVLDQLAALVLRHRGEVHVVGGDVLPRGAAAAAELR